MRWTPTALVGNHVAVGVILEITQRRRGAEKRGVLVKRVGRIGVRCGVERGG